MRDVTLFMRFGLLAAALCVSSASLADDKAVAKQRFDAAYKKCFTQWYTPFKDVGREPVNELCTCLENKTRELNLVPAEGSSFEEVYGPADTQATPEAFNRCIGPFFAQVKKIQGQTKGGMPTAPEPSTK